MGCCRGRVVDEAVMFVLCLLSLGAILATLFGNQSVFTGSVGQFNISWNVGCGLITCLGSDNESIKKTWDWDACEDREKVVKGTVWVAAVLGVVIAFCGIVHLVVAVTKSFGATAYIWMFHALATLLALVCALSITVLYGVDFPEQIRWGISVCKSPRSFDGMEIILLGKVVMHIGFGVVLTFCVLVAEVICTLLAFKRRGTRHGYSAIQ
eukprot:Rhum_TRINITY_DN3073_c0_g1::Rhum_TRINITY_DN3073_c0_g1_i1::g.9464::m.9464